MSYTVTCYCNDETIKTSSVYIASAGITRTGTYGSSSLGDYEEFTVSGLTESWSAKFTATPASGCSFYRWVYRVGSTSATAQYSYSNPFTYTGGKNIYIRAEGTQDVETWDLSTGAFGAISSSAYDDFYLGEMQMYRYSVTFNYSGTATFYTTGSLDTYGYLSTSTGFDSANGKPTSILAENDDGDSTNFSISYDVTAGTTYYVWVRPLSSTGSGSTVLNISVPDKTISIAKWSWTASNGNASASLTQAAYSAVVNKTAVTNFSYLVWNDLCDKVKEILDATGGSWDSTYATYANTKMASSNKTLTATKFNSLRYNIGSHYSTGITDVYTNDDVLGSYFTKLASCINGWIDTL